MNYSATLPQFGSMGPPTGPRRTLTGLSATRQTEIAGMMDTLINTVQLKEAPTQDKPNTFKVTMGANGNEYTVVLKRDTTFVATRSDGAVTLDLFHNTWNFGNLSLGYTNKNNPDQTFVTPYDLVEKGRELSAKLKSLITAPSKPVGMDI